eukprot:5235098-Prymnesium_polylepis.1
MARSDAMISSLVGEEDCLGDSPSLHPFGVELEGCIGATLQVGDVVAEAFAVAAVNLIGEGWVVPYRNIGKGRAVMHGKEGV